MRIITLVCLVVLISCDDEKNSEVPAINEDYSIDLENNIRKSNDRISENLNFSYWQVDMVRAQQEVYGIVSNFDPIDSSFFELRDLCGEFKNNLDSSLKYDSFKLDSFKSSVQVFETNVNSIISQFPVDYPEDYFLQIEKILNPTDFNHFGNLSENKFRVEKELYKGRVLEVEQVAIQWLLTAFRYESCD